VFGLLTLWVAERWAWSLVQLGIFLVAAWSVWSARRFHISAPAVVCTLAALWPLAQLAANTTVNRGETWVQALNWISFLAVFLVASSLLRDEWARRCFLRAIAVFGVVLASVAVLQDLGSGGRIFWLFPSGYTDHVMGPFVNRNQYAAWVELLLPLALYLAATSSHRALYGVGAALMLGSVIASATRAGSVIAILEIPAVGLALASSRAVSLRSLGKGVLQFAALAALAAAVLGWQDLHDRLAQTAPDALRADGVRASLIMVRNHPWMGTGLGTWPEIYPRYASIDTGAVLNQAHNDWLQWAAEGGLPFLALMLLFALFIAKPCYRSVYGLGVPAFLIHALVDYPLQQRPALAAWFFALAGAACASMADTAPAPVGSTRKAAVTPITLARARSLQAILRLAAQWIVRHRPPAPCASPPTV
jgi:O-antigen ligase